MPSFFEERLAPLGVTAENNRIMLFNPEAEPPMPKLAPRPIFQEDSEGNIEILYYTIEGQGIVYYTDTKNPQPREYKQVRLREPKGDMKYRLPKGQGTHPWFHPSLVEKYKAAEKIETLFLTEGAFKGWMGCECQLDVVGLPSITHYAGPDKAIHADIRKIIEICQVDNLAILWDGDCLDVSIKGIRVREEATRRPFGFFNAAKRIRKLVIQAPWDKPRSAPRIFFMHVKSEAWEEMPKGLDDLLVLAKQQGRLSEVVGDARRLDDKGPFFYRQEISSTTDILYKYFGLDDAEKFYRMHSQVIGEDEFFFRGDMYHYSERENKLRLLAPKWAESLRWIGDEFYEEVVVPSAYGDRRRLEHRKKETLTARFGQDFRRHLKYYHGFVNLPNHFQYERIVERNGAEFYNRYFPFPHVPKDGKWENISRFLKHIFGEEVARHPKTGEKIYSWEMGLDYLQIMLTNPTQQLPILVLYSPENQTGKSTLGQLQKKMFGDNVIFVGNADLQSDFNELYCDKLLVICEETSLDRQRDSERLKNMSTAREVMINPKGQKQYAIDVFMKFQFYSNKRRMVYLTRHDDRYWIIKVPALPAEDRDPTLPEKMYAEIPAFVHHLRGRKLRTQEESRMHFHPALYRTEVFEETVRVNEPTAATDLRSCIRDMFYDLGPEVEEIEMPLKNIREEFFSKSTSESWLQEILKDYLQVDLVRDAEKKAVYKRGEYKKFVYNEYANEGEGEIQIKTVKWKGRPYLFKRDHFLEGEVAMEAGVAMTKNVTGQNGKTGATAQEQIPF